MKARLLTAAVGLPLLVVIVEWGPVAVFAGAVGLLAALGFRELTALAGGRGLDSFPLVGAVAAALVAASPGLGPVRACGGSPTSLFALALVFILTRVLVGSRPLEQALPTVAVTSLGVGWLGLLASYLVALRMAPGGAGLVLTLLAAVWGSDACAYLVGRAIGRHRLAPRLSPGKTVEGAAGGLVGAIAGVAAGRALLAPGIASGYLGVVALGALLAAAAVAGDLAESAFKRGSGVKDSGGLFPGHGGVLDRLDSLLVAAPVMYHYLCWQRFI